MSFLKKKSRAFRIICGVLVFLLIQNNLEQVQAQPTPFIPPGHNYFIDLSIPYSLPVLRGMRVYPAKPFEFDFVVDSGNRNTFLNQRETSLLVKYFLTCLTIPEEDLWVNLSPYESGKIIPDELSLTNAGNTLLEQDKLLKQLASSLTYPESRLGKKFWEQVYKKAYERFGTTDLPVNTYNKVWIVPDKAIVYDMGDSALIGETHLKVMLEEDYLALRKHIVVADRGGRDLHRISSIITKEIILPELEKEINGGKNFAPVRQIFHSMVLAAWFKRALKRNVLSNLYVNKKKISGIDGVDKNAKEEIYKQYLHIYKVGAYNYIREDVDPISQQVVPRKYFSGGFSEGDAGQWLYTLQVTGGLNALQPYLDAAQRTGSSYGVAKVVLNPIGGNIDSAQVARSPILRKFASKFVLTVALSLMPLAAGGLSSGTAPSAPPAPAASAQVLKFGGNITPADSGYIQKIRKIVHIEDVIALNGQKNPQTGKAYNLDIPYIERNWDDSFKQDHEGHVLEAVIIAFQHKFGLRYEDGRLGLETKNKIDQLASIRKPALEPASWTPSHPALPIAQESAQQPAVHSDKRFYTVSQSVFAIPIEDHVVAKRGGIVTGLDTGKKEYKEGEIIFTLQDPELDSNIQELTAELQNRESKWGELKVLFDAQAATDQEVKQAQQQVQEVEQKLAQAKEEKADDIVAAPHDLKILDIQVTNGLSVSKGTQLLRYSDRQRIRVDIDVPIEANYFNDINLTLNGAPVRSIFSYNWSPTPSLQKTHLSLIAVPSSPILPGQAVKVSARINSPDKDIQKLYSIAAGQTTLVEVGRVEEYPLSAPAAGAVNFLVHEGDKVKEGQLLARVDVKPYQDELDRIDLEISNIDGELNQAAPSADGTQYVGREQIDNLKIQRFKVMARQKTIQEQIARTEIRSPYNSVIDWSAENIAGVFQNQDVLFHIPGPVFLGDINNAKNAILFSRGLKINAGDPVLVQTPNKIRLAAVVTAVNKNPSSPSIQLSQYQSVEVKVFDPQHALRPGLGVQISLIKEIDKQAVLNILSAADNLTPSSSSPPPPPPKDPFEGFASQLFTQRTTGLNINLPQAYFLPQGQSLNSTQLEQQVLGNKLLTADEASDYLQKKLSEQLPGAPKFDLTAGAWRSGNGQLSYIGGVQGAFNNIAGQFLSGNAINPTSAALDVIFAFSGKIIDHFDHKIAKEKALAAQVTMTAYYGLQNARFGQVNHAKNLLIELGAAQQGKARLEGLKSDLKRAREEMLARESGGFTSTGDRLLLEEKISDVQLQISELERGIQSLTVELNASVGQPRAELRKPISADLPWTGRFASVSDAQEKDWLAELTGDKSPDPRMQEALTARKVMEKTMALQRLKKLPAMNFAGVLTPPDSQDGIKNSIFEPLGGETWRVSEMTPGTNLTLGLDIPIYDKQRSTLDKILNIEREKTENKIEKTKLDIAEELAQSVGNIRSLSREIDQAEEAYNIACKAWELKAGRPDIYLPHDLVDARVKMNQSLAGVLKLKAQYLKEEAKLRQMGVLKSGESLVKDQAMVSDQAQLASLPSFFRKLVLFLAVAVMPLAAQQSDQPTGSFGGGPAGTWALMHGGSILNQNSLAEMERILIHDPNIFTREDALQHFLGEYQDNKEVVSSMETVILHSPYQDVVQGLFRFMISRNNTDLRFFIQIINKAEANKNKDLIALAYQSLEDVLTNNPDIFKNFTRTDFITSSIYPQVSPETAKAVFLAWLAADTGDSIARARFLQSNYWSPQDLAGMYNELNASADPRNKNLAQLIYDSILWQEARANIEDTIPLSWYKELNGGIPNLADSVSRVRILELREQNRRFLNSSRWREMKKYLNPALYAKAEKITRELIANNPAANMPGHPLFYIFYNGPITNTYFNMLDLAGQRKYIEESGISELARILDTSTYDREIILDRLMASRDGRLLALKAYNETGDGGLLELMGRFNWLGFIKTDAQDNENPAADHIFREALLKMYQQTHNGSFLDLLLEIYSSLEMSSGQAVQDPRGDALRIAEINRRAAAGALEAVEESWKHRQAWSLWRGFDVRQKEELDLQARIKDELGNEDNPEKFGKYLDEQQAKAANPQSRGMLKDLMSIKHQFAGDMEKNDQSVPHIPVYLVLYMSGLSAFLGFLTSIVFNVRGWFRHRSDAKKESQGVRKALLGNGKNGNNGHNGSNGNHGDKAMLAPPIEREIPKPALDSLQTWRNRMVLWSKQDTFTADAMLSDFNLILNCAAEVLRTMPYSPDLIWSEKRPLNEDFRATLDYFFVLADDTLTILEERLQNANLSEIQRQQLILDKDAMVEKMRYAVPYLVVLKYRSTIEKVMGYKFADGNWKEKFYWLARWYLYYEPLIIISNRELRNKLPDLLDQGSWLMPGLYKDRDVIVAQSNEKLDDVIAQGKTAYNPQSRPERIAYKKRSFQSRMLSLIGPALFIFSAASGLAGFATVSIESLFTSIFIIALTIYVFWKPHKEAMRMELYDTMKWLIDQHNSRLDHLLDPSGEFTKDDRSTEQRIVDLAKQEGLNEAVTELDPNNSPRVDAIVIISQEGKNVGVLKKHVEEMRGEVIRKDIPVEVISPQYKGSANAYFEALLMMKKNFEARQGPYSNVKPWKEARVAFIFHGREAIRDSTLIDWSIINAYRAAASMSKLVPTQEGGRAGSIIIFSRDFYAGPLQQVPGSDTTILTSRVNGDALNKLGWVSTSFSENGDSEVDEVLEKVNIKDLLEKDKKNHRGSNTVKFFRLKRYDLYNALLKQFSAFSGIILMGPDAVAEDARIAERLQNSGLMELLAAHLTSDVIIPKLIARNPDDNGFNRKVNDYVEERSGWPDFIAAENALELSNLGLKGIKSDLVRLCKIIAGAVNPNTKREDVLPDLKTLYNLIGRVVNPNSKLKELYTIIRKEAKPDSKIHAYVPHGDVYMPNIRDAQSFKKVQSLLGVKQDAAMSAAAKGPGGIDLNFQPQFIQRTSSTGIAGIRDAEAPHMTEGFKGFNFNIVRFTSQLTVNGAFQLMFTQ